jgi:hypothetical protein
MALLTINNSIVTAPPLPLSGSCQTEKNSVRSAVGTVIADRPPPKSVQAEFPHTAPTLGA